MKIGDWVRTHQITGVDYVGYICDISEYETGYPFAVYCLGIGVQAYAEDELELISDEEAMLKKLEYSE